MASDITTIKTLMYAYLPGIGSGTADFAHLQFVKGGKNVGNLTFIYRFTELYCIMYFSLLYIFVPSSQ